MRTVSAAGEDVPREGGQRPTRSFPGDTWQTRRCWSVNDLKRVSWVAVFFLVALRISIGWQFLYEGLWKKDQETKPDPWTSEGYLRNAQGPFRDRFREMVGDPDELGWLDYAEMSRRWYDYRDRFVAFYQLTQEQQDVLNRQLDGAARVDTAAEESPPPLEVAQSLNALPPGVDAKRFPAVVGWNAQAKRLTASGPLLPSEEAGLQSLVDVAPVGTSYVKKSAPEEPADPAAIAFYQAVTQLAANSRKLSYRHRLAAALRGDPEAVGVSARATGSGPAEIIMGTATARDPEQDAHLIRYGKIQEYKDLLREYDAALKKAAVDYQFDHANKLGRKVALDRAALTGPIKALDREFREAAQNLLTAEQRRQGALPRPDTPLSRADRQVMWGLLVLGGLLIFGLFTRGAAVLGAVMLMMFYLVIPPWPGVPIPPGQTEHALIVNKNMIEAIALLAIAALPTGSWFGLDGLFSRGWRTLARRRGARTARP